MIKLFEMFAGYGGASFALKKAKIPFETVGYSEIDKFAIQCYNQNHENDPFDFLPQNNFKIKNYGDATKIDPNAIPDFDLLTGGFPCQAFSVAGKGLGEQDTRGTLFHEIIRIAEIKKPKYMLLENVKGLTTKRHKDTFEKILSELDRIGYFVYWKILNSKNYGIPQNRERVWFVCFRKPNSSFVQATKKSIKPFFFPEEEELKLLLKDILEKDVDGKYYLKESQVKSLMGGIQKSKINPEIAASLQCPGHSAGNYRGMNMIQQLNNPNHSNNRVYSKNGISPTLNCMQGGDRQPFVCIKNATKKGYQEAVPGDGINLEQPNSKTRRGRVQHQSIGCLQTNDQRGVITEDMIIRKLTPKECFRLMGFLNDEINLDGLSNTQKYKLAGNGWEINVVSKIFEKLLGLQNAHNVKKNGN